MGERITDAELIRMAFKAMENAYVPYSGYKVGAALLAESGRVYTGCNIENASYTPTVCAERTAFFKAVSEGERRFSKIAIVGGKGGEVSTYFVPCGVCRQVMSEFCDDEFSVIIAKSETDYLLKSLNDLLPCRFSPQYLVDN